MKLYTTIENEKGKQESIGGNEYLDIDIKVGNKYIGRFTLRYNDELPDKPGSGWALFDNTDGNDEPLHWILDNKHDPRICENSIPCFDCMEIEQPKEWARQMKIIKGKKQKKVKDCGNCGREATQTIAGMHRCDRCATL